MGRLSAHVSGPLERSSSGGSGGCPEQTALEQLRGRLWSVRLGPERVRAELIAVHGRPPLVQARLAVPVEDRTVTGAAGSAPAQLHFDLHISELPADLRAALQGPGRHRSAAASLR